MPKFADKKAGIACPKCGSKFTAVVETRSRNVAEVHRRRQCVVCDYTFATKETYAIKTISEMIPDATR